MSANPSSFHKYIDAQVEIYLAEIRLMAHKATSDMNKKFEHITWQRRSAGQKRRRLSERGHQLQNHCG